MNKQSPRFVRTSDRAPDALRPVRLEIGAMKFAEGSALVECGDTRVLVSASVERRVPPFRIESGQGWVTAEYSMLPRATHTRSGREVSRGRPSGRTAEIQRLIGRSLRAIVDMSLMPETTVVMDCDVLQADGGTRTAAITGGYVALVEALGRLFLAGDLEQWPVTDSVAAVSVGLCDEVPLLDLEYVEDSEAQVDMNVVATGNGRLVEVQSSAERRSFSRQELDRLLDFALKGIEELSAVQEESLGEVLAQVEAVRAKGPRRKARPKDEDKLWGAPD